MQRLIGRSLWRRGITPSHQLRSFNTVVHAPRERSYSCFDEVYSKLQKCSTVAEEGQRIHGMMLKRGLHSDEFLANILLNFYGKCHRMDLACQLFDEMPDGGRSMVSWTTMISAHSHNGEAEQALRMVSPMLREGLLPNEFTFGAALRCCAALAFPRLSSQLHSLLLKLGFQNDVHCASALIHTFSKCAFLSHARTVFDAMPLKNVVSWNSMIAGYVQNDDPTSALCVFRDMMAMDAMAAKANCFTLASVFKACGDARDEEFGRQCHALTLKLQIGNDKFVGSSLIEMYSKSGNMIYASTVFERFPALDDVVIWNVMISGYAQNGQPAEALELFRQMLSNSFYVDHFVAATVVGACACAQHGTQVHAYVIKTGNHCDLFVGTGLLDMYSKLGCIEDSERAFHDIYGHRNVATWNTLVCAYVQNEHPHRALALVSRMHRENMEFDRFTYTNSLRACASIEDVKNGGSIHAHLMKCGVEVDAYVGSALIDMYAKCACPEDARLVFDRISQRDSVSWTAMISCCTQHGQEEEALSIFAGMQSEQVQPNKFTVAVVLKTCAALEALQQGKQLHGHAVKCGGATDKYIGSALVDMYSKCGDMHDSERAFEELSTKDMVSWSAMLSGYAKHGYCCEAINLFCQMHTQAIEMDQFTLASCLAAVAGLAALKQGKSIHAHVVKSGHGSHVFVESALVDMYSKSGCIDESWKVFDGMRRKSLVSWSAMISALAQHGKAEEAVGVFEEMKKQESPDALTFVGLLTACSRGGLVDQGKRYFQSMLRDHHLPPKSEHYACMVDLLGRAGLLSEAEQLINEMPFQPSALMWRTLLCACRTHRNVEAAEHAAEWVLKLDPAYSATYVMLSNIYAECGKWAEARKLRELMKKRGLKKEPGISWIEVKGKWHSFAAADQSFAETEIAIDELTEITPSLPLPHDFILEEAL